MAWDDFVKQTAQEAAKPKPNGQYRSRARSWRELTDMPKPAYIIKGLIEKGALIEIYGGIQSGKSFIATDMGMHIIFGWRWCGRRVRKAGVLYVSAEGGTAIVRRLEAFAKHHGVRLEDIDFRAVIEPTNLLDPAGVEQIIVDAQSVPNLGVIFIDTANRCTPGSKEDAEAMGRLVAACDAIRAATGAAVVLVHHSGKDEGRGSRGSNVLPAAVDVNISVSKSGDITTVELEKQRDGQIGTICAFRLNVIDLGQDEDGDALTSCVVELVDATQTERKPGKRPNLPPAARIAFKTLKKALAEAGEPAPASNHIPAGVNVVSVELWRKYHYAGTASDQNPDARRKGFQRSREQLQAAGAMGMHDDQCWIVP